MNKKGLAMQTLVVAILCLVVLVIMIYVFKTQITESMEKYTNIANQAEETASSDKCGFLSGTRCTTTPGDCETVQLQCPEKQTCCKI
jgi:ABC-type sulfate transport system permease component